MSRTYRISHLLPLGCEITIQEDENLFAHSLSLRDHSVVVVITDINLFALYGNEIKKAFGEKIVLFPPGEEGKTFANVEMCWKKMLDYECDRKSCVVAIGGGMITDLAGFAAACYMRGIDHVFIPTSLLGMVDAAIGGKTAVNLQLSKNLVGAIHQPKQVFINPLFLQSLSDREFCGGIAEVIKYGIIHDASFFEFLENHMEDFLRKDPEVIHHALVRSAEIKAEIVASDVKDQGDRAILNFGHSFAHGIESATNFRKYLHGEAVSIGMCLAANLSHLMGECEFSVVERIKNLCKKARLPTELHDLPANQLIACMSRDKKNVFGKFNLIVVKKIGKVVKIKDVDVAIIEKAVIG